MIQRILLDLSTEQLMLLEKKYRNFLLGGAVLDSANKTRFREMSEELVKTIAEV